MIDHLLAFADQNTAIADPAASKYYRPASSDGPGGWDMSVCLPGIFVWAPAQDVTQNDANGNPYATHTPYDGLWRMLISVTARDAALSASPACELVADRAAAAAGQSFLLQANLTSDQLGALMLSPMFAGMEVYPFGNAALI